MILIEELLEDIAKTINVSREDNYIYYDIVTNPQDYWVSCIIRNSRELKLGEDTIPYKGKILTYEDNEFYDYQDDIFKLRYPELATKTPTILVERCEKVSLIGQCKVLIDIRKYVITKKKLKSDKT